MRGQENPLPSLFYESASAPLVNFGCNIFVYGVSSMDLFLFRRGKYGQSVSIDVSKPHLKLKRRSRLNEEPPSPCIRGWLPRSPRPLSRLGLQVQVGC